MPDLRDFVAGLKLVLKPTGVITVEFPHLLRLMEGNQFDTIYHEHFSYFSFCTVENIFAKHGLIVFDVEEIATHGGSLRLYARHADGDSRKPHPRVSELREREMAAGIYELETYSCFGERYGSNSTCSISPDPCSRKR